MEQVIDMRVSGESSKLNTVRTRAALRRFALALERALKVEAPINKRGTTPKLRPSIQVRVDGDLQTGFDIRCTAIDTVKYVVKGTVAHRIPKEGQKLMAWQSNNSASLGPISGFNGKATGDMRRLVRSAFTAGATTGGTAFSMGPIHHPGTSANDFVARAYLLVGPELAKLEDEVGQDIADQVMASLGSIFSNTASVRI